MSYWTPEKLKEFLNSRPTYREVCDGLDCGNFPEYRCFHCNNYFCFDCGLKHFGLPLEKEYPECGVKQDWE